MRRDEIVKLLQDRPFKPFRLILSNGTIHEIRHPEMAIVLPSAMYIGIPATAGPAGAADDIVIVSLVHIVQSEYMAPVNPSATNP